MPVTESAHIQRKIKAIEHTASTAVSWHLVLGGGFLAVTVHGGVLATGALCLGSADTASTASAAAAILFSNVSVSSNVSGVPICENIPLVQHRLPLFLILRLYWDFVRDRGTKLAM